MSNTLRWGILGTGNIARQFAGGLATATRSTLVAVGSRAADSARAFATKYGIAAAYASYEQCLNDPNVDAIYNSLPNSMHHEWTLRALRAGKHVLCEKPFAMNAQQAEEMFDVAGASGRVLAEAFMYRSHPLTHAVVRAVTAGEIGRLKLIRTSFCYRTTRLDDNIRFKPELGGGSLMDIGCYCLNFARHLAGAEPVRAFAVGHLHASGVDDYASGTLEFPGGLVSTFSCGMTVQANNTAVLAGEEGWIEIPLPWKPAPLQGEYVVCRGTPPKMDAGGKPVSTTPTREARFVETTKDLYAYEADDFAATVLDGSAPRVTRQDTIGNMQLLDTLRRQLGMPV